MNLKRMRMLKQGELAAGPVVYWMSRDQRADDNWALLFAQQLAVQKNAPLAVVFCLTSDFLGANLRHYDFMLRGLQETAHTLSIKNIPFFLLIGEPSQKISEFIKRHHIAALVTDFDPLRIKRQWKQLVADQIDIPFYEVDAHNIVPCWLASPKQEYGAYTLRPKIHRAIPEFLDDIPALQKHRVDWPEKIPPIQWDNVLNTLSIDRGVSPIDWLKPGSHAGINVLEDFIENKLHQYDTARNDPTCDGQSNLSPYLHFGQIAPQRAALAVQQSSIDLRSREPFLEELIVRRELSDNFCFYNENYDNFKGFPTWARESLNQHRANKRDPRFTLEELENARTYDTLWNASQIEMIQRGKMHGYMRMYWAKKILEWTDSPEQAMQFAITLNDKYEVDGRDPNGYVGIAWSIGGVHDRAWKSRPIFGKIRYLSYNGAKSKFDVKVYIQRYGHAPV
jgi:deoxyribodipyrimidine photo-lyase